MEKMDFVLNENIYNAALISKIKKQTGPKINIIIKNLRNLVEEDLKGFSKLKIKIFEEKKPEIIISAPIIGFQYYFEEFKKLNSRQVLNNTIEYEEKNTPSTANDNEEEEKQIDSSDISEDE